MMTLSSYLFAAAFAGYFAASVLYITRVALRRRHSRHFALADRFGAWALRLSAAGVLVHAGAMAARWAGSGQAPMTNMFEYVSFLGWSIMLFFTVISAWYRLPALGAFVAPVGLFVIAYASVFPTAVRPLVPALQSYWLVLHVATAALGEGAFAVSFGAALMYLLRVRGERAARWEEAALELLFYLTTVVIAFLLLKGGLRTLLPLGRWSALLLSLLLGTVLYALLRLLVRGRLRELGSRAVAGINPDLLDDVSYRAVAVGFPLFTLGGLVFAMIWAQKAWGAYWSWDPKEVWALISWLFYSGYLHLRGIHGWQGRATAWVSVIGFVLIMFTLVGVNLLLPGLHSYATT